MSTVSRFERRSPFTLHPKIVLGEGPVPAKIMLIGERPGVNEARVGRPFVGPAGELLDTLLAAANLDRKQIYITNLVKTFADYDKPTSAEIEEWGQVGYGSIPSLMEEISQVNPDIIGCLGTFATEFILHRDRAEMARTHGVPVFIPDLSGRIVVPMFHPAAALHSPETMNQVLDDFLRLGQLSDGELSVRGDLYQGKEHYDLLHGIADLPDQCPDGLAVDTEFTPSKVLSAQISFQPGTGLQIDAKDGSAVKILRRWLETTRPRLIVHNYMADAAKLRELGIDITEYEYLDTMVMAYQLCIEPQGLKALGYRHCGMEMEDYDDLVREHSHTKALDYLLLVNGREWPAPEPSIVLDKGLPKVYKPQAINKLIGRALLDMASDKRDKDGNPVDLRDRWHKWADEVKGPVIAAMGDMPVATLEDVDPARAQKYGIRDADATLRLAPVLEKKIADMGLEDSVRVDHAILPMIERMQEIGIRVAGPAFWQGIESQCDAQMGKAKYEIYKLTGEEVNPGSGDQVAWLLYEKLGLRAPYQTDSGTRGSVDGVALEMLLSEAPVVQHIMDYTEASKIRGTYAIPFAKLASRGERVHATFRVTRTTTGRLSMADPPLHQIPIMTELGRQLRAGFIARPGYVIGDWDVDQLEMRTCCHDSLDPELIRLFNEDRDIHAETACKIFSVSMGNLSVGPSGKVNDIRRTVAKHAGFGIINGITEHGLVNYMILNRCKRPDGEAWTLDDCDMLRRGWLDVYKGVDRFQQACIAEARATGLTRETISGRIMYLPAVWSPDKRVRETAERNSYVMHTQGGGASIVKRAMAEVWREVCKYPDLKTYPLLQVHDELVMEVPDDECIKAVVNELMTQALTQSTKLIVPMKASGGYAANWLEAH
jgi:uracil-DNA glycosylase family 4